MFPSSDFITVDNPNGPDYSFQKLVPFAEWVDPISGDFPSSGNEISSVAIRDLNLPNFYVRTAEGIFPKDAMLLNTSGVGNDLLGICLFPKVHIGTRIGTKVVEAESGMQNYKYDPNNDLAHFLPANKPFHIIHFAVNPDYLFQFFPENEKWAADLQNKIAKGERTIGERAVNITLAQQRILQNILECPLEGKMASAMMEASIVQLILLHFNAMYQSSNSGLDEIKKKDKVMVNDVKEFLLNKFLDEHSLESLSRQFGTNTNKLMALFKRSFGKSIFEFISELRMEFAHKQLQKKDKTVFEIARLTGYKNPNHFSTAFKRKFGISPSQIS